MTSGDNTYYTIHSALYRWESKMINSSDDEDEFWYRHNLRWCEERVHRFLPHPDEFTSDIPMIEGYNEWKGE